MGKEALLGASGYTISFQAEQEEEIQKFFDEYGFVIIEDVLSCEEVQLSVNEVWSAIEAKSLEISAPSRWDWLKSFWTYTSVKRDQPGSHKTNWPCSCHGIFADIACSEQLWRNRISNQALHRAFQNIIGCSDLLVSIDRFGCIRPDDTQKSWFHWDLNPWFASGVDIPFYQKESDSQQRKQCKLERLERDNSAKKYFLTENNATTTLEPQPVQGLVSLTNNHESGFMCIPGFHKKLKNWAKENPKSTDSSYCRAPLEDPYFDESQALRVMMKKGSLLIWSSALPHCNYSEGSEWRMCQYIKMFPSSGLYPEIDELDKKVRAARKKAAASLLPSSLDSLSSSLLL